MMLILLLKCKNRCKLIHHERVYQPRSIENTFESVDHFAKLITRFKNIAGTRMSLTKLNLTAKFVKCFVWREQSRPRLFNPYDANDYNQACHLTSDEWFISRTSERVMTHDEVFSKSFDGPIKDSNKRLLCIVLQDKKISRFCLPTNEEIRSDREGTLIWQRSLLGCQTSLGSVCTGRSCRLIDIYLAAWLAFILLTFIHFIIRVLRFIVDIFIASVCNGLGQKYISLFDVFMKRG